MRVSAHSVLLSEEQRDRFLALLSGHGVSSKPKRVTEEHNFHFVEFQLPNKWKEHEMRSFLNELETLIRTGQN